MGKVKISIFSKFFIALYVSSGKKFNVKKY